MAHHFRFIGTPQGDHWILGEEDTVHLAKVLKLEVGASVEVTDGNGRWCEGRVTEIKNKQTTVESVQEHVAPRPETFVTLAIGAVKPGALDELLPGIIELGVDEVVVFQNEGTAKFRVQESAQKRWDRIIHQSIKQCKRAYIPAVTVCDSVGGLIDHHNKSGGQGIFLSADAGVPLHEVVAKASQARLTVVIGSEKGLESHELSRLQRAGFTGAKLGSHILRAVTAVPAALGVVASFKK